MKIPILTFVLLILISPLKAQNDLIINSEGTPPMSFYVGEDYGGSNAVWDVIQSDDGLIYIGVNAGLYEFDGRSWRKVTEDGTLIPRNFAKTDQGNIYVAGHHMMGYLTYDSLGKICFKSLDHLLPEGILPGLLEYVNIIEDQIYFNGLNGMAVYDETKDELSYYAGDKMYPAVVNQNKLYFTTRTGGLKVYENDTIKVASNSNFFQDKLISEFFNSDGSIMAISSDHSFHVSSADRNYTWRPNYLKELWDQKPYKVFDLSEKYNAITYLSGGVVVTDKSWKPVLHLGEKSGINKEIHRIFLDKENNLWLATGNGVVCVELGATYSIYNQGNGVAGYVLDLVYNEKYAFLATSEGVSTKPLQDDQMTEIVAANDFLKITGSDIYNDDLVVSENAVLGRAYQSIAEFHEAKFVKLFEGASNFSEIALFSDSTKALSIGSSGHDLKIFESDGERWLLKHTISNKVLPKIINNLKYDQSNDLFWASNGKEFVSFSLNKEASSIASHQAYAEKDGLPKDSYVYVQNFMQGVLFSTKNGVYAFDSTEQSFYKPEMFYNYFDDKGLYKIIGLDNNSYVYSTYENEMGVMQVIDSDSVLFSPYAQRALWPLNTLPVGSKLGSGVYLGSSNQLTFIQNNKPVDTGFFYPPLIRQVDMIATGDSAVFYGNHLAENGLSQASQEKPFVFGDQENAFRFTFSIPYYRHPDNVTFRYYLKGFDTEWSFWSDKVEKEYTNLSAGEYSFFIEAKNGFGAVSEQGSFEFQILPPWYQTLWAYSLYTLGFIGLVYLIVLWNTRRLRRENERLEGVIGERTQEIRNQKETIEKVLVERESLLKEIHHRVKNNLQIIASLLYLQSGKFENEDFKKVLEDGQGRVRSMALIHQKLYENEDLKSIPFGEYLQELTSEIRASFGMNNIQVNIEAQNIFFDVDTAVPLGLIVNEMATNAFKYAFDGTEQGSLSIFLSEENGEYTLNIKDDGSGIPDEIDIRKTKSLGLRLVRMLSQQLEGDFEFKSDNGTSFELKFAA